MRSGVRGSRVDPRVKPCRSRSPRTSTDCAHRSRGCSGSWHGNGHGDYPTIEAFQFGQELVFQQDGRPFIHYFSRAWIVDEDGDEGARRRPRDRLPAAAGRWHRRGRAGPQHRLRGDLVRRDPPRAAAARDGHRRRGPHRDGQGVRRRASGSTATSRATCCTPTTWPRWARSSSPTPGPSSSGGDGDDRHDDWPRAELRGTSGYRLTPAARADPRPRSTTLGHATPDEVLAEVREHSSAVNVSTVYRTLEVLEELGLVRHAHLERPGADLPLRHATTSTSTSSAGIVGRVVSVGPDVLDAPCRRLRRRARLRRRRRTPDGLRRLRRVPRRADRHDDVDEST